MEKVCDQNDNPASRKHSTATNTMKVKELLTSRNSNEGAFMRKLDCPKDYQQPSHGNSQQPYNDDKKEQNQRTNEQLSGGKRTRQGTQHGTQIGYPFQGPDSMLEDCAASKNEKVDIVKVTRVAKRLINETSSKLSYPFLTSRFLARVNVDKSGAIDFEKTLIHGQKNLPPPTLCQTDPAKAERLPTPERKELESEIRDYEHQGQEKPRRDNLTIPTEERTLSEYGKVLKFDRGVSEDVLETDTKGNKQYNIVKDECSDDTKSCTPGIIVKKCSNETENDYQWNAICQKYQVSIESYI